MWSCAGCGLVRSIGRTLAWFRVGPRLASRDGRDVCVPHTPGRHARHRLQTNTLLRAWHLADKDQFLLKLCQGPQRGHESEECSPELRWNLQGFPFEPKGWYINLVFASPSKPRSRATIALFCSSLQSSHPMSLPVMPLALSSLTPSTKVSGIFNPRQCQLNPNDVQLLDIAQ